MAISSEDLPIEISTQQVGRGVLWAYLAFASGKAMVFVSTVILARLLTPQDFGLVGLASLVAGYLGTVHTFGVGEAFIQSKFHSDEAANATFVLSVTSGVLLFVVSLILTPAAIAFFHEPRIGPILPTLAFTYIISGITTVHDALLVKRLKFQLRIMPTLVHSLFKGVSSIALALLGYGAWAIVWGIVIGSIAKSVSLLLISPWRVSRAWSGPVARDIFGFGGHLVLLNVIGGVQDNFDYLAVGRRLGSTQLGLYTLGFRAPELIIVNLASVISEVAYPVYSKIQTDLAALRQGIQRTVQMISWVTIPAGAGLAVISGSFVRTFYTDKWNGTIPVMQILALYAAVFTVTYNFGDAYKAMGRPDILNKVGGVTLVLTVLALWFGANYGIVGVAWAHLLRAIVMGTINVLVLWRLLGSPPQDTLNAIARPVICSLIMVLAMFGVASIAQSGSDALILVLQTLTGIFTYLMSAWLLNRIVTQSLWSTVQQVFGRKVANKQGMA